MITFLFCRTIWLRSWSPSDQRSPRTNRTSRDSPFQVIRPRRHNRSGNNGFGFPVRLSEVASRLTSAEKLGLHCCRCSGETSTRQNSGQLMKNRELPAGPSPTITSSQCSQHSGHRITAASSDRTRIPRSVRVVRTPLGHRPTSSLLTVDCCDSTIGKKYSKASTIEDSPANETVSANHFLVIRLGF